MTDTTRLAMMTDHVDALWPPVWCASFTARTEQPFFVTSHPDPTCVKPNKKVPWVSSWYRLPSQLETAARRTLARSTTFDEYYGVNLGRADCQPSHNQRLKNTDIAVVPGLLGDFDGAWGAHKAAAHHLPDTLDALVAFLHRLPSPPTLIVNTRGGVHAYHLFPEPWILQTPEDRTAFCTLAERFQATLTHLGQEQHGWTSNGIFTADLTRVLRLPGTTNHKYGTVVTTLENTGIRYSPEELGAWLQTTPQRPLQHTGTERAPARAGTLDMVTLATHYGMELTDKSEAEVCGSHPVHGSDTGTNVAINPTEQVWTCFRHGSGGGCLEFLAVCEGLLPCEKAKPGGLRGITYIKAVRLANAQWQAKIPLEIDRLDDVQAEVEAHRYASNQPPRAASPAATLEPESSPPAQCIVHHAVPPHILRHPDRRVREHWKRIYRRTALLKEHLFRAGVLS